MKNLKFYFLIGFLLSGTLSSWAQTSITQDDIAYTIDNGTNTATVTDYLITGGHVNIPNLILHNGVVYIITNIGERAFQSKQITSVELPLGLIDIADKAFLNNPLTEVIIPNKVISIGMLAFAYNEIEKLTLGASVASIADGAFEGNRISTLISYNPNPVDINNAFIFLENEADIYLEVPPESIDEYTLAGWTTPFPFESITEIDQTSIGTIGINTDTPTATLHIKGFTDTTSQPNLT